MSRGSRSVISRIRRWSGAAVVSDRSGRLRIEAATGARLADAPRATDGCSIPTYAVPLKSFALGFARMATGRGFGPERAKAAKRLLSACMAEPFLVAGTGKADLALMQAAMDRIGCGFVQMYGMTETSGTIVTAAPASRTQPPTMNGASTPKGVRPPGGATSGSALVRSPRSSAVRRRRSSCHRFQCAE